MAAFKRHVVATELSRLADLYMLWSDVQQDLIDHLEAHPYEMRWPCDLGWARRADVLIDVLERGPGGRGGQSRSIVRRNWIRKSI